MTQIPGLLPSGHTVVLAIAKRLIAIAKVNR
jgi:hypothetical protein